MSPFVATHMTTSPLRLTFYGDDFTGSTDAMEGLALAGLRTVLFLEPPPVDTLQRFPGLGAAGVAGLSRAMTPAQMEETLPGAFHALAALGAPFCHYKVCSTFDSSPDIGNIGRAMEIGRRVFGPLFVPVVVGLPKLGRYCAFGNLFARSGADSPIFRLDRHPTMRHHPTTPMDESDLRLHLARLTNMAVALFDLTELEGAPSDVAFRFDDLLAERPEAVLFDVTRDEHLSAIGRLLGSVGTAERPLFAVGSSAVEYALASYWQEIGAASGEPDFAGPPPGPVEQIAVASGSCSPVTARQIDHAIRQGFAEVALEADRLVQPQTAEVEQARAIEASLAALARGRSVIIHTCTGPNDPRIAATGERLGALGHNRLGARLGTAALLGGALGTILRQVLERSGLRRAVVAGGDTSSHVGRKLGLQALEMLAPTSPGAPLCRAYAPGQPLDGLEVVFKGGQNGKDDFFSSVLHLGKT